MRHKSMNAMLLICLFLGGLTVGCKKTPVTAATPPAPPAPQQEPAPAPPKAPTASLIAEPATIERGQAAMLRWSSTDATELTISGLGVVEGKGSREVRPAESTVYRLTVSGPGGSATATAAVNVNLPAPPVAAAPQLPARTFAQRVAEEMADAYFDYDHSNVRDDAQAALTKDASVLSSILADFGDVVVYIEGHCDERGSAEYNLGLGDRRATSASAYLSALGVDTARLKTVSYGKERPQCTEATEECWQKNRRVHFSATNPAQDYRELLITSGQDQ